MFYITWSETYRLNLSWGEACFDTPSPTVPALGLRPWIFSWSTLAMNGVKVTTLKHYLVHVLSCITRLTDDVKRWRNGQTVARLWRHKSSVIGQFKRMDTPTLSAIGQQWVTAYQVNTWVVGHASTALAFYLPTLLINTGMSLPNSINTPANHSTVAEVYTENICHWIDGPGFYKKTSVLKTYICSFTSKSMLLFYIFAFVARFCTNCFKG